MTKQISDFLANLLGFPTSYEKELKSDLAISVHNLLDALHKANSVNSADLVSEETVQKYSNEVLTMYRNVQSAESILKSKFPQIESWALRIK